jgi:DNA repair ATPase RecN
MRLLNFQSHPDSILRFHPGVNVIIGESDQGKTSIFRALYWLRNNRPSGDDFVSNWADRAEVELETDDDPPIHVHRLRSRGGGVNQYYVQGGQPFEGFGLKVPPAVVQALNIEDINLQPQMAGPYLLGDSPSEVARYLNQLVDLDIIDRSVTNIRGILSGETRDLETAKATLKQTEEALEGYKWLPEAEGRLTVLEGMEQELKALEQSSVLLETRIISTRQFEAELASLRPPAGIREKVEKLWTTYEEIQEKEKQAEQLDGAVAAIYFQEKRVAKAGTVHNSLSYISELQPLLENRKTLNHIIGNIVMYSSEQGRNQLERDRLAATMPEECPLCGGPLK